MPPIQQNKLTAVVERLGRMVVATRNVLNNLETAIRRNGTKYDGLRSDFSKFRDDTAARLSALESATERPDPPKTTAPRRNPKKATTRDK